MEEQDITARSSEARITLVKSLNTKGCCFLCLKLVQFKTEKEVENATVKSTKLEEAVSLKCAHRHLKIDSENLLNSSSAPLIHETQKEAAPKKKEEVKVELCESCTSIMKRFSKSFLSFEKAQMEVNYWMERIHQEISEAAKKPELVQNYSKRMTSDPETLTQLVFVDNLRKEIAKKGGKIITGKQSHVELLRLSPEIISQHHQRMSRQLQEEPEGIVQDEFETDSFPELEEDFQSFEDKSHWFTEGSERKSASFSSFHPSIPSSSILQPHSESTPKPEIPIRERFAGPMYINNSKTGLSECLICKKAFSNPANACAHYKSVHLGIGRRKCHKCDICQYSFVNKKEMESHRKQCNGMKPSGRKRKCIFNRNSGMYNCATCKQEFRSRYLSWEHFNLAHRGIQYKCDLCGGIYLSKSSLAAHKAKCDGVAKIKVKRSQRMCALDKNTGKYNCVKCKQEFADRHVALIHYYAAHQPDKLKCDICGRVFKRRSALWKHKKTFNKKSL